MLKSQLWGCMLGRKEAGWRVTEAGCGRIFEGGGAMEILTQRKAWAPRGLRKGQEFHSDTVLLRSNLNTSGQVAEAHPLRGVTWCDTIFKGKPTSPTSAEKQSHSFCPARGFSLTSGKKGEVGCKSNALHSKNLKHLANVQGRLLMFWGEEMVTGCWTPPFPHL